MKHIISAAAVALLAVAVAAPAQAYQCKSFPTQSVGIHKLKIKASERKDKAMALKELESKARTQVLKELAKTEWKHRGILLAKTQQSDPFVGMHNDGNNIHSPIVAPPSSPTNTDDSPPPVPIPLPAQLSAMATRPDENERRLRRPQPPL